MNPVFRENFSLKELNHLRLPCRASLYAPIHQQEELVGLLKECKRHKLPLMSLGEGTNIVLPPRLHAICLHIKIRGIEVIKEDQECVVLRAAAGENWHDFVADCLRKGYFGLENLALIPGNIGAAPIQNIGAYGREIKDFLIAVDAIEINSGKRRRLSARECGFAYRTSKFKEAWQDLFIIIGIELKLNRLPKLNLDYDSLREHLERKAVTNPTPMDIFNAVCQLRRSKLPQSQGNVGSFFHNPTVPSNHFTELKKDFPEIQGFTLSGKEVRVAAASLIESCGWKGYDDGKVGISPQHALCMINTGGASQQQVLMLAKKIIQSVKRKFDITLSMEPRFYEETS